MTDMDLGKCSLKALNPDVLTVMFFLHLTDGDDWNCNKELFDQRDGVKTFLDVNVMWDRLRPIRAVQLFV